MPINGEPDADRAMYELTRSEYENCVRGRPSAQPATVEPAPEKPTTKPAKTVEVYE